LRIRLGTTSSGCSASGPSAPTSTQADDPLDAAPACARGLAIRVRHYPPGTSKWNKIDHRLFCHVTQTWRGRPLTDRLAIVELIGATTTRTGLKVECALDPRTYQKGVKVSQPEVAALNFEGDDFHPEWNYSIRPRNQSES